MQDLGKNNTQDSTSKVRQCFKDEEYDGQLFQKGTGGYEGKIRNLKMGVGNIVCSEAGIFVRPPPLTLVA